VAYTHEDVIRAQYDRLTSERARAAGDYESARIDEDVHGVMSAADRIVEIDARIGALGQIANNYIAGQQRAQPTNKYGLSRDEIAIARGNGSGDPRLTNDDRDRIYAEQKSRYQRMRSTGEYRDDQGTVRR
jgi:hypothetical protein